MNNQTPLVSIVMPVYNGEKYIRKAIDSVFNQTFKDFELIIIDDGSTDNTIKEIEESNDFRIVFIKNKKNIGLQKTLNKGLRLARGQFVARLDADDEWIDSDKLKKQLLCLEENHEYILIGTGAVCVDKNNKLLFKYNKPYTDLEIRKKILGYNCFIHSSVLFDRKTALSIGGYSEDVKERHVEDYDLWLRMGLIGKMKNLQSFSVKYSIHDDSIGSKYKKEQMSKNIYLCKKYKKEYRANYRLNLLRNYTRLLIAIVNTKR